MFRTLRMTTVRWSFAPPFLPSRVFSRPIFSLRPTAPPICRPLAQAVGLAAKASDSTPKSQRMPAIIRPMVPSAELLHFVDDHVLPRAAVLKNLSSYVKKHNLQDPDNKRIVLCDDRLKKLLGVDKCTISEMAKHITPHLKKPEVVGGRYLEEANRFEQDYLRKKAQEDAQRVAAGLPPKGKKRSRKAAPAAGKPRLFKPVILSPQLAAICRKQEMPRPEILKAVWEYIRLNNLQKKPGNVILCDFLLRQVYGASEIDVQTVMKGISKHVTKKEST